MTYIQHDTIWFTTGWSKDFIALKPLNLCLVNLFSKRGKCSKIEGCKQNTPFVIFAIILVNHNFTPDL